METYHELLTESIAQLFGKAGTHPIIKAKKLIASGEVTQAERDSLLPLMKAKMKGKTEGKLYSNNFDRKNDLQATGFEWDGKAWIKDISPNMTFPDGILYTVWIAPI